jgi:cytosine/adenosine deaminase-related metal-dependent hydrolase
MEDIGRFARELSRVLRRGGYFVLTDLHPDARARGWKRSFRHGETVVEVASFQRSIDKIREAFAKEGFEALECVEPAFGEAERPIFEKCAKAAVFDELVGQTAIVVFLFRLPSSVEEGKAEAKPRLGWCCSKDQSLSQHHPGASRHPSSAEAAEEGSPGGSTWLLGGHVALDAQTAVPANLEISGCRIQRVIGEYPANADDVATIDLRNYLLLPGLINAHDHLEFNLFPRLGRGPYSNSAEWARDIYHPERSPVREHLSVPMAVRLWWGGLKNLLSGVTTVCHHNPWDEAFEHEFPVQVLRRYGWAHSLTFGKNVLHAFSSTGSSQPFIIHAGEGTDPLSADEVFELDRMSVLGPRTVLVHGVGFSKAGHALRAERDASLIWCPSSNRFVLGTTLNIQTMGNTDKVALGSDSALTARGSLLDEIRAAHEEGASPDLIFRMVTETAASILLLRDGEGTLRPGAIANIIAIPWTSRTPAEALVQLDVSQVHLVMVSGRIHLAAFETRGLESIEAAAFDAGFVFPFAG